MQTAAGKSILNRLAAGKLCFYHRAPLHPEVCSRYGWQREETRFLQAQHSAVLELAALYDRAARQVGEGMASVFAIHAMLLEDEDFVNSVLLILREKGATAEYAVQVAGESFAAAFCAMDSPYMQARAVDIRDITRRVMGLLMERYTQDPLRDGPAILAADEFLPSEVMELDQTRLMGLVSLQGSVDSHTAMLLRAYGIPALAEVELDPRWDGHMALLDGVNHRLYLDPDRELVEQLYQHYYGSGTFREYA